MGVLGGFYRQDTGEILIDGKPVRFREAREAIRAGIGMVHQHFKLVPVFTVAENVVLGAEPTGALDHLDIAKAREQVRTISARYGLEVDPDAIVEQLPVGIQQRVEIIKVLFRSAELLIFDEPTAVLTPHEVVDFFNVLRSLRQAGKAIIFITHKLREVLEVADRISVLRGGKVVGETDVEAATPEKLAEMMVGRPIQFVVDKKQRAPGKAVLEVKDLRVANDRHEVAVQNLTLTVREGEIVGIAGVQGDGQTELVEALTGMRRPISGTWRFWARTSPSRPAGYDTSWASRTFQKIANVPE
jgi:simple sugar transport system ATP-binding protein